MAPVVKPLPHPAGYGSGAQGWSKKQVKRLIPRLIHAAVAQPRMQRLSEVPFQRREERDVDLMAAARRRRPESTTVQQHSGSAAGEGQHLAAPSDTFTHQRLSLKYSPAHTHTHTPCLLSGED